MNDDQEVPLEQNRVGANAKTAAEVVASLTPRQMAVLRLAGLQKAVWSGGGWFYWIAGLSVVNTVMHAFGGAGSFVIGLGATQILDVGLKHEGGKAAVVILPVNLMIFAIYAMFGYFAGRGARWAFITGMVFYALDTLICFRVHAWLSIIFHVFAGYGIYRGLKADSQAKELERQMQMGSAG